MKWVQTPRGWVAQSLTTEEIADRERRETAASKYYENKPTEEPPAGMKWVRTPAGWVAQSLTDTEVAAEKDRQRRETAAGVYYENKPTDAPPAGMKWVQTPAGWVAQSLTDEEKALSPTNLHLIQVLVTYGIAKAKENHGSSLLKMNF